MLKLSNESRGRLLALSRGPGFEDLIDLCARLCEEAERGLLQLDRANGASAAQILSAQDQCRAQRIFVQNMFGEIEAQARALVESQEAEPGKGVREPGVIGVHEPVFDAREFGDVLGLIPEA